MPAQFSHGKLGVVFYADNLAGDTNPVVLTTYTNNVTWPLSTESHETTSYGDSDRYFQPGLNDNGEITVDLRWNATLDGLLRALKLATASANKYFHHAPLGTGSSGLPRRRVAFFVTGYEINPPVDDIITATLTLRTSGAVDFTTTA